MPLFVFTRGVILKDLWVDVLGYEDCYQVSNNGKIKTKTRKLPHNSKKGWQIFKSQDRKTYYTGSNRNYEAIDLYKDSKRKKFYVHRLVFESFVRKLEPLEEVNHIDANPKNNKINNLEAVSRQENVDHYYSEHKKYKGYYKNNISGGGKPYCSRINVCGVKVSLGYYKTKQDAQKVFSEAYLNWHGKEPKLIPIKD